MIDYGKGVMLTNEIPADAVKWRNLPDIMRWCRQVSLISEGEQKVWLDSLANNPKVKMFGIQDKEKKPVGVCGLTSFEYIARHAEFSLYIAPEYQIKGFGKAALLTLLKHGFDSFNLNKIWGETFDNNPALSLFKDIGMQETYGHRQHYFKDGKYLDTFIVSILQREFHDRNP